MKSATLKLLPVGYPVYHAIAELNRSLEQAIEHLEQLASFSFFRRSQLQGYQVMLKEIRALASQELIEILNGREFENSAYYERLRLRWQKQPKEPSRRQIAKPPRQAVRK